MARPITQSPRSPQVRSALSGGGFTLVELEIVISILAVLAGILLPSLDRARSDAQSTSINSDLSQLSMAVEHYHDMYDSYPTTEELIRSGLIPCHTFLCDGTTIKHKTRSRIYEIDSSNGTEFTLRTYPIAPYDYGAFVRTRDEDGIMLDQPTNQNALASEAAARKAAVLRLTLASARLISEAENPENANQVPSFLETLDPSIVLSSLFDTDMNDHITWDELAAFTVPRPDDTEEFAQIRIAFAEAWQIEDPFGDARVIPVANLQGDPATLFAADNYRSLIESLVTKKGVANSLAVKVEAAQAALADGSDDEAVDKLDAFKKELKAQTGKSISADNAKLLNAMIGVLYPVDETD